MSNLPNELIIQQLKNIPDRQTLKNAISTSKQYYYAYINDRTRILARVLINEFGPVLALKKAMIYGEQDVVDYLMKKGVKLSKFDEMEVKATINSRSRGRYIEPTDTLQYNPNF